MKSLSSKLVIIPAFLINMIFAADVTFQVDMQDEELTDNVVYLVGDWDLTFHEMEFGGNNICYYTNTITVLIV